MRDRADSAESSDGNSSPSRLQSALELLEPWLPSRRAATDAARMAVQSAAAAASAFLLMRRFGFDEEFLGVLSAVLVVQPSVGHTLGAAKDRVVATLVGSALGFVSLVVLPSGYGTAAALAASMLVMNAVAGLRPQWRYGSVAAVAMALGSSSDPLMTAQSRAIAIGIGAAVGTTVALVVWPDTATKRARRHLRSAMRAIADRLDAAIRAARSEEHKSRKEPAKRFHSNLESAREAARGVIWGDTRALRSRIDAVERLYNSVLILDRVAEETNSATGNDEGFGEDVESLRRQACEIILKIAEGELPDSHPLDDLKSRLNRTRDASLSLDGDDRDRVLSSALTFGLGEVIDGLQEVIEASAGSVDGFST